jgi:hypothetical protein
MLQDADPKRSGRTKTAMGPAAPTGIPAFNYTTPPMTTGIVPTSSTYLAGQYGGAARLDILSGRLGILEVVFAATLAALIVG